MRFKEVKVSAPSKVILHGEHAVVYGHTALAASLDLRTRMTIKPHKSSVVVNFPDVGLNDSWTVAQLTQLFRSKPLGNLLEVDSGYLDYIHDFLQVDRSNLQMASVICFLYLYSIITDDLGVIPMEILVESEIPLGAGLGSSAALSVCLAAGLTGVIHQVKGFEQTIFNSLNSSIKKEVCQFAFVSEKILHGTPSGIDNSISTYGGISTFSKGCLNPLAENRDINVLLVNTKIHRNTKELVTKVRKKYERFPSVTRPIMEAINAITLESLATIRRMGTEGGDEDNYRMLEDLVEMNQSLLSSLGVSHPTLDEVCAILKQYGMRGKLTGAGGGGFAFAFLHPSLPEKSLAKAIEKLETVGYVCNKAKVGVPGFTIDLVPA